MACKLNISKKSDAKFDKVSLNKVSTKEHIYSKSPLEEDYKSQMSPKLKMVFENIIDSKKESLYYKSVYNTVQGIISTPFKDEPNFDVMIDSLKKKTKIYPWLNKVIKRLEKLDSKIKNEFVYLFNKYKTDMVFGFVNKKGTPKVLNSNFNDLRSQILENWKTNFYNLDNGLVIAREENEELKFYLNQNKTEKLINRYEKLQEKAGKAYDFYIKLKQILSLSKNDRNYKILSEEAENFGFKFSKELYENLMEEMEDSIVVEEGEINKEKTEEVKNEILKNIEKELFYDEGQFEEIFDLLSEIGINLSHRTKQNLYDGEGKNTQDSGKIMFLNLFGELDRPSNTLFSGIFKYLKVYSEEKEITDEDNLFNNPSYSTSVLNLADLEGLNNLDTTVISFRDNNKNFYGYNASSYIQDIISKLKLSEEYRNQLKEKPFNKVSYMLKLLEESEKFREDIFKIRILSPNSLRIEGIQTPEKNRMINLSDKDNEFIRLLFFQTVKKTKIKNVGGIPLRFSRLFLPTLADRDQAVVLETLIHKFDNTDFEKGSPKEEVIEYYYNQVVQPELNRIYDFIRTIKDTNIDGYDVAAQQFNFIYKINLILNNENQNFLELLKKDPNKYNEEWFEKVMKPKIKAFLKKDLEKRVNDKLELWKNYGFIQEDYSNEKLYQQYLNTYKSKDEKEIATIFAYDYIINTDVALANMHMLFIGDPALYAKESAGTKLFLNRNAGTPLNNDSYKKFHYALEVNLNKRLSFLLSIGQSLSSESGEKFLQVFMKDNISLSPNIKNLIKLYYPLKEDIEKGDKLLKMYNESKENKNEIIKELKILFPKIADYIEIEATDSQEYTTLKEHLNVLMGKGQLNESSYKKIVDKLETGEDLTNEDLKEVFPTGLKITPMKPVSVGMVNDTVNNVMRFVAVKSSSIPLIPSFTKGMEIDKLRILMEKIERETGLPVRASYQSANKIGGIKEPMTVFNDDGSFNDELELEDLRLNSLEIERSSFRIQQENPFKEESEVTSGTQPMKIITGNGIIDVESGFKYEGKDYSGKEIEEVFNKTYNNYYQTLKNLLLTSIDLDENGNMTEYSLNVIKKLLKEEALNREYPLQTLDGLELIDNEGLKKKEFTLPLWMSSSSDRFESFLISFVNKKFLKMKLPGSHFVLTSGIGFVLQKGLDNINKNNIIIVKNFTGLNGELGENQVLMSSNLTDNKGNIIDLQSSEYVYRDDKGILRLDLNKIDPELLESFSFRVPTSGFESLSNLEIAGFLPNEMKNLLVIPKNIQVKKGVDFDNDKEFIYTLWSRIKNGKIEVLGEKDRVDFLNEMESSIKSDKNYLDQINNILKGDFNSVFKGYMSYTEIIIYNPNLSREAKIEKLTDIFNLRLYENSLLKAYNSVVKNKNEEVQKMLNLPISVDFARKQAEEIEKTSLELQEKSNYEIIDANKQIDNMNKGSSGNRGIGIYSHAVTFLSHLQEQPNKLILKIKIKGVFEPYTLTIGNFTFDGVLGATNTLDGDRKISTVLSERQNTALDNANENVMGRVNVNMETINFDTALSIMGFDKGEYKGEDSKKEISISYYILSQPVIIEYVKRVRNSRSNVGEKLLKQEVINELKRDYLDDNSKKVKRKDYALLTPENLVKNLSSEKVDVIFQAIVFKLFEDVNKISEKLSVLRSSLNFKQNSLGDSIFNSLEKIERIRKIYKENTESSDNEIIIENSGNLFGDYVEYEDVDVKEEEKLFKEGYIKVPDYYIKPTTRIGGLMFYSTKTVYDLLENLFIYNKPVIVDMMTQVLNHVNENGSFFNENQSIDFKKDLFKYFREFLNSYSGLNVFQGDILQERKKLYMDHTGKKIKNDRGVFVNEISLVEYLRRVMENKTNSKFKIRENYLIKNFKFNIGKKLKKPSLIKLDLSKLLEISDKKLYEAYNNLINDREILPEFNGEDYDTISLAKDLITYAFLGGGVQRGFQFTRYIPNLTLEELGYNNEFRKWNNNLNLLSEYIPIFIEQYFRHNIKSLPAMYLKQSENILNNLGDSVIKDMIEEKKANNPRLKNFKEDEVVDQEFLVVINNNEKISKINDVTNQLYTRKKGGNWYRLSALGSKTLKEFDMNIIEGEELESMLNFNFSREAQIEREQKKVEEEKTIKPIKIKMSSDNLKKIFEGEKKVTTRYYNAKKHIDLKKGQKGIFRITNPKNKTTKVFIITNKGFINILQATGKSTLKEARKTYGELGGVKTIEEAKEKGGEFYKWFKNKGRINYYSIEETTVEYEDFKETLIDHSLSKPQKKIKNKKDKVINFSLTDNSEEDIINNKKTATVRSKVLGKLSKLEKGGSFEITLKDGNTYKVTYKGFIDIFKATETKKKGFKNKEERLKEAQKRLKEATNVKKYVYDAQQDFYAGEAELYYYTIEKIEDNVKKLNCK